MGHAALLSAAKYAKAILQVADIHNNNYAVKQSTNIESSKTDITSLVN